ncbi:MAG: 50S ribosomal protein L37e [archaeon]
MTDGKPSFGKRNKRSHSICRRCGKHAMHIAKKICASCGFGNSKRIRKYSWQTKTGLSAPTRK